MVVLIIIFSSSSAIPQIINDVKVSHAQFEVKTIAIAILCFKENTGKWPARDADGIDNSLLTLVSGNAEKQIPLPVYASDEQKNYFGFAGNTSAGDYIDNHLALNQPKGNVQKAYASTGINYWNGPYLQEVGADPWGNAYVINIVSAYDNDKNSKLLCYVLSAGPDGIIQTDSDVDISERATHAVSGDDIVFLLCAKDQFSSNKLQKY